MVCVRVIDRMFDMLEYVCPLFGVEEEVFPRGHVVAWVGVFGEVLAFVLYPC